MNELVSELLNLDIPAKHLLRVLKVVHTHIPQNTIAEQCVKPSSAALRKRRQRDKERDMSQNVTPDVTPKTVNVTSESVTPSPSLSSPPAPPPAPSPTPPSPPAPTPAPPHPPTPAGAREAGDALALVIEAQPKPDRFDEFWKLYPRKVGKENARKKWETIKPEMVDTILAAVVAHTRSQDWCKEDGRFIPHPATWLHGHRWEDELKPALRSDVQAIESDNEELGFLTNDDAIFHKP